MTNTVEKMLTEWFVDEPYYTTPSPSILADMERVRQVVLTSPEVTALRQACLAAHHHQIGQRFPRYELIEKLSSALITSYNLPPCPNCGRDKFALHYRTKIYCDNCSHFIMEIESITGAA